jgi:hypothetical protein
MRLKQKQKEHLLSLVAEGKTSDEINARAAAFEPPYSVSRQQVDFYRASRGVRLEEIKAESESGALRTGLALKERRVETLSELGERLKRELLAEGDDGRLWLRRKRAVGSGQWAEIVEVEEFNLTQINALRAVLDDIAKEMGERTYGYAADDGETEDDSAKAGAGQQAQLKIRVEYVGGDNADAADAARRANADCEGGSPV